jgi:hypothetical protein
VGTDTHTHREEKEEKGNVRLLTPIKTRHFSLLQLSWRGSSWSNQSLFYISHKYAHTRRRLTCSLLYFVRLFYIFIFSTRVAAAIRLSVSCSFFYLGPALAPAHLSLLGAPVAGHTGTLMRKRVQTHADEKTYDGRTVGACAAAGPALYIDVRRCARVIFPVWLFFISSFSCRLVFSVQ